MALAAWGRRAMRERRRFAAAGFWAAMAAFLVVGLAILACAIGVAGALGAVAAEGADAATRATALAAGIAESMNFIAFGVVISLGLYVISAVLLMLSRRTPGPSGTSTGTGP